ncbi:uncharacterized protein TRIADDRAFT_52251 [Trichoplax adhaerens]|uniref:G-protein coupled receptors family 1 profile domain-containing protein n=1 Tax=Trichoplax adhaerens TaxID=10228 RepID=B3RM65_TRIAD|nr:hypothetical protein TRIADDRAFT_52251 [Trichoplax adhaerens]EDV29643.1 hypothetical protein TRIADDRAFT_52251 [Trichoplax adhaerens]|eukprot:XP_002108845.1 hypothetical protein TRIADDRAFT_52251 [Trichoplax adhaerens]
MAANITRCYCSFSIFIPVLQQFLEGNGLRFDANNIICRIYSALPLYFGYANLNSMTLLAGVRYIIIVKPQQSSRLNDKSSIAIICIINWILPIAFIIPQIFGVWGRFLFLADIGLCVTYASYTQGTSQISHFIIVSIFQFFLPISICCWCYMEIFLEVRGSRKRVFGMTASPSRNENTSEGLKKSTSLTLSNNKKTELAVAKTLSVILLIYLISYVPYSIITVIVFCNPKPTPALLKVQAVMIQVTYIANVSNPIVFLFRSPKTRAKIQEWYHGTEKWIIFLILIKGCAYIDSLTLSYVISDGLISFQIQ